MTYVKYHDPWLDFPDLTTPIVAAALDHIEDGIVDASQTSPTVGWVDPRDFGADTASPDNTAAFQAAIDAATGIANEGLGTVIVPPGNWQFTGQLLYSSNVNIMGFGENTSILVWPDNVAPGSGGNARFCMDYGNTGYGGFTAVWSNFTIRGNDPAKSATGNICGPRIYGVSLTLRNVLIDLFKYGLCNGGDHNSFYNVVTTNCFAGLMVPTPKLTGGDNRYYACNFNGVMAAVHIEGDGIIGGDVFSGCGFHAAIGIYQDDASFDGTPLVYSLFENCSFEHCGNAVIYFENGINPANFNASVVQVKFVRCALELTAAAQGAYPGDHDYFTAYAFVACEFGEIAGGSAPTNGWFRCWKFNDNHVVGINILGIGKPVVLRPDGIGEPAASFLNNRVDILGGGKGRIEWFTEAAVAGDLQEWIPFDAYKGVRKARAGSLLPFGVAVRTEVAGTAGLLQTSGFRDGVTQDATGSTGALAAVSATTDGTIQRTDDPSGADGSIVGYWGSHTSGSTVVYLTLPD